MMSSNSTEGDVLLVVVQLLSEALGGEDSIVGMVPLHFDTSKSSLPLKASSCLGSFLSSKTHLTFDKDPICCKVNEDGSSFEPVCLMISPCSVEESSSL